MSNKMDLEYHIHIEPYPYPILSYKFFEVARIFNTHFLMLFILILYRFIFCRAVLALFWPREESNQHGPVCLPELPNSFSPSSKAVRSAIIRLADHLKVTDCFHFHDLQLGSKIYMYIWIEAYKRLKVILHPCGVLVLGRVLPGDIREYFLFRVLLVSLLFFLFRFCAEFMWLLGFFFFVLVGRFLKQGVLVHIIVRSGGVGESVLVSLMHKLGIAILCFSYLQNQWQFVYTLL